jgi:hypothetical protein
LTPVTLGCVPGDTCPAAMKTLGTDIVTFEVSLLLNATVTPPVGAAVPKMMGYGVGWFGASVREAGSPIVPGAVTATLAVVLAMFGVTVLAVIVVDPAPPGVTGTFTLFWFAGIVTETGAVATPVLEEVSVNVTAEGAKAERTSERFCTPAPATTLTLDGKKLADAVTLTDAVADPYPLAEAVRVALPKSMPFTAGVAVGVVCPALIKTLPDTTVTFDVSLLESNTVTPLAGAGAPSVIVYGACWPGATFIVAGNVIEACTVTLEVVSARLGKLLAWTTVLPGPRMVSGTSTVVVPCAKVTVESTVPTLTLLEDRLTARPPIGAAPDRVNVRFCVPPPVKVTLVGVKARVAVTCTVAVPVE